MIERLERRWGRSRGQEYSPSFGPKQQRLAQPKRVCSTDREFFTFAVAGGGKSESLVNAFRGVRNNESGTPATGVIETTSPTIARYTDPNPQNPKLVCIPTTKGFTLSTVIVVFDNRFTATDIALLRNCEPFKIPSYIVRSKSNQNIGNVMQDMGHDSDEVDRLDVYRKARDKYIAETRRSVAQNLADAQLLLQRAYIVYKDALVKFVNRKPTKGIIDGLELPRDLLRETHSGRCKV
ncbi:hypothetical protein BKA93DRAFT_821082 [Sparassis latifolia]